MKVNLKGKLIALTKNLTFYTNKKESAKNMNISDCKRNAGEEAEENLSDYTTTAI